MNSSQKLTAVIRMMFALLVFILAVALLFKAASRPAVANTESSASSAAQSDNERQFENKVPKHLPISIRIHPEKEKAVKDLNNNRWHHDFALEVKNTGDKPIYYLYLILEMPEIKPNGDVLTAILVYGHRSIFDESKGIAQPEDIPLRPNETVILNLGKRQADGWDERRAIENLPQPKKLEIVFMELNFGDGTGFGGTSGAPWPVPKSWAPITRQW
jgi:hypothetical protein